MQISTDGFAAYPEAVDLAFGPYAKYGTIIKDYRNATMIYTPSEMVGTQRTGIRGIGKGQEWSICTSHVERLNGTQRLFLKRLNRLTLCFSKKLRNLEAAFAMFAAYYNFCWRTRKPGKSGKKRPTAAMMAKLTDHLWGFDEFFDAFFGQQHSLRTLPWGVARGRAAGYARCGSLRSILPIPLPHAEQASMETQSSESHPLDAPAG